MPNKRFQLRQRFQLGLLATVPAVGSVGKPIQKRAQAKRGDKAADAIVVELVCYAGVTFFL